MISEISETTPPQVERCAKEGLGRGLYPQIAFDTLHTGYPFQEAQGHEPFRLLHTLQSEPESE